ncbi:MAG: TolC family protein [Pseudomonadota bacterium]
MASGPVTLARLLEVATGDDPWLTQNKAAEQALRREAIAAGALPDPRLNLTLANLPMDSLRFSQEPMTQLGVGISQAFPAGNSRQLKREQLEKMGDQNPVARTVRTLQLRRQVTSVWLQASLAARSINLIAQDRQLFDQLLAVTGASYGASIRQVNQQDIIRAQLELTRLDERTLHFDLSLQRQLARLSEWLPPDLLAAEMDWLPPALPQQTFKAAAMPPLLQHPEIRLIDHEIEVARVAESLAREAKRPAWQLNAGYAYRDRDLNGRNLPDFVTLGVSVDLPLFTSNRQDQRVLAAADRANELLSARLLKLKELQSRRANALAALAGLEAQASLYRTTLLPQLASLARSALDAYGADRGDFADVMRAYIAQLNARLVVLELETRIAEQFSELDYLSAELAGAKGEQE